jgi:hypothetical protein
MLARLASLLAPRRRTGAELVDWHAELLRTDSEIAEYNRQWTLEVTAQLEAWWAVAGHLVAGIYELNNHRLRQDAYDRVKAQCRALEAAHPEFWCMFKWLDETMTSTYVFDMTRKVSGEWINADMIGIYDHGEDKGYIARGSMATTVKRIL